MSFLSDQTQANSGTTSERTTLTFEVANRTLLPVTWQSSTNDCLEEERRFLREFESHVLVLVRQFNRRFPYKQSIIWSIEYDTNKEYCIHVMASQHRS